MLAFIVCHQYRMQHISLSIQTSLTVFFCLNDKLLWNAEVNRQVKKSRGHFPPDLALCQKTELHLKHEASVQTFSVKPGLSFLLILIMLISTKKSRDFHRMTSCSYMWCFSDVSVFQTASLMTRSLQGRKGVSVCISVRAMEYMCLLFTVELIVMVYLWCIYVCYSRAQQLDGTMGHLFNGQQQYFCCRAEPRGTVCLLLYFSLLMIAEFLLWQGYERSVNEKPCHLHLCKRSTRTIPFSIQFHFSFLSYYFYYQDYISNIHTKRLSFVIDVTAVKILHRQCHFTPCHLEGSTN